MQHLLERGEPALATPSQFSWGEPSVTSFEAFRATYDRAQRFGPAEATATPADSIPEPELQRRYAALRADRIAQVQFRTRNGIVADLIGLVLASALFLFHWRWLQRRWIDPTSVRSVAAATQAPPPVT